MMDNAALDVLETIGDYRVVDDNDDDPYGPCPEPDPSAQPDAEERPPDGFWKYVGIDALGARRLWSWSYPAVES
jgi:hypothetical protein